MAREWERGWERMFVYVFLWLVAISVNILTSLFVVSLSRVWVSSSLLLLRFSKTVIGPLGRHSNYWAERIRFLVSEREASVSRDEQKTGCFVVLLLLPASFLPNLKCRREVLKSLPFTLRGTLFH